MRKLVRIFMTVVAGMMAFSCVTDTTDDLGVNLGKGQKTVISASLEESRTQLGGYDKDAKKYPMYWSAGDKISANGVVSEVAQFTGEQSAVASFAVNGLGEPDHYFVTYPAVANDWQVKFAAEQKWTMGKDTFDEGVSTMYGYSEEGLNVQMNHLTGILKIGITGEERVTLEKVQISTVDRKPIAGTFDFAFEKDAEGNILTDKENNKLYTLTPTADAKSVIEYSFGDIVWEEGEGEKVYIEGGQSLSSAPTYIHVAVPAGTYDELYVTLYDINGGVMYATVKAGDTKPLKAGAVREFKKDGVEQLIEYTPTADNVYIVSDAGTLAGVKNNLDKIVVMVADVDMTNESWTSIANFAGEFYGNGYAIKGLTASLFGITTASVIKGVHLEDVAIEISNGKFNTEVSKSSKRFYGALAHVVNNTTATIENCSVSGDISVDVTGSDAAIYVAAIIGSANTTNQISNLVNKANLTIEGAWKQAGYVGGCIVNAATSLYRCKNIGSVKFSATTTSAHAWIGGISGVGVKKFEECVNGDPNDSTHTKGTMIFDGNATGSKHVYICGFGDTSASGAKNCANYAKIDIKGTIDVARFSVAGLFSAYGKFNGDVDNCNNYGPIYIDATIVTENKTTLYAAGVGNEGGDNIAGDNLKNCTNEGAITITSKVKNLKTLFVGGIANTTAYNYTKSNLTNKGDFSISATGALIQIGGLIGTSNDGVFSGTIKNEGDIKFLGSGTEVYIGGNIGIKTTGTTTDATFVNTGDITCTGTETGTTNLVGGLFGKLTNPIQSGKCYCTIDAKGYENVGMLIGSAYSDAIAVTGCKVGGTIYRTETQDGDTGAVETTLGEGDFYKYIYGSGNPTEKPDASVCVYWDGTEE